MTDISDRDLQSDVSGVLRRVEAGQRLRVTVRGRPVDELVPLGHRPRSISWTAFLEGTDEWLADPGLGGELSEMTPDTTDDIPVC